MESRDKETSEDIAICLFPAKLAVAVCATKTYLHSYQNKKKKG